MAEKISDDQLREMAAHRLLKLVKSKRRKPGVGDYGKFGLTDADGNEMLGFGNDGLTASAEDVEDYLRANAAGTWKQSADTVPARTVPKKPVPASDEESGKARPAKAKFKKSTASPSAETRVLPPPKQTSRNKPASKKHSKSPDPKPASEPILRIRVAKPHDAEALATLLSQLNGISVDANDAQASLDLVQKAKGGTIVAELDEIIGCCSWIFIPTLHRGQIGRITVLIVDKDHRRKGLGSNMLGAATEAMKKMGCTQIETMSDIAVSNSHNFFRSVGFEQASYRFVSKVDRPSE